MRERSRPGPQASGDGASAPSKTPQNEILAALPANELGAVLARAAEVSFTLREELFEEGDTIERVYFPLTAMISIVSVLEDGTAIEIMTVGREGFIGFPLLNDVTTARYRGMCQIAGQCLSMDTRAFLSVIDTTPELKRRLRRYSQFANEVAAQSVACNSVHDVEQRLARWLLTTSDAVGSKTFDITQEFLSQMLAVRRPGVTVAMGALARRGLLEQRYGKVILIDVEGLKKTSCECYRKIKEKERELLA
jgi:CRP-like cAMP-binding protein